MRPLSLCRIDGIDAYAVTVNSLGAVSAEVGFMLEGRRFGMAQLSGLEDHPEVADLAKRLIEAIEGVVANRMGSAEQPFASGQEYLGSGGRDI